MSTATGIVHVATVQGAVHRGRRSRYPGKIVLACSGRTIAGTLTTAALTCGHCHREAGMTDASR